MALNFLEFEQPIAELEAKIEELKFLGSDASINIAEEVKRLQGKSRALTTSIFANLSPWQITQLARHPQRPYTLDYGTSCTAIACTATISPSWADSRASKDCP